MGIYCITNTCNNKKYIGSAVNLFKRLRRHNRELVHQYHSNEHLLNSYNKYGKDAFVVEIIEEFEYIDKSELLSIENEYIKKWDLCNSEKGYNKRTNDVVPPPSEEGLKKIKKRLEDIKIKIMAFDQHTGEFFKEFNSVTEAAIALNDQTTNISNACKSLTRTCKGYVLIKSSEYDPTKCYKKQSPNLKRSEEQKLKCRMSSTRSHPVFVYTDFGMLKYSFVSINEASQFFNFPNDTLSHVLKRKNIIKYNNLLFSKTKLDLDDFEEIWNSAHVYIRKTQ